MLAVADLAALIFVSADEGLLAVAVAEGAQGRKPLPALTFGVYSPGRRLSYYAVPRATTIADFTVSGYNLALLSDKAGLLAVDRPRPLCPSGDA